ncbi:MAG: segregation/condensation protein A [Candidatus Methanoperedens sp.]|nr:segregation/condensation protein A [Candidatus Methanoperedens sp.]MCE8426879.1 segregation/condensation protein A [Candidatus Methanoperedens sp.]
MTDGTTGIMISILEEPIEILVNLAKNGEIDPWNIDIVEVTDKFLRHVEELEKTDLRISGRTLLYAAILLRMKANALVVPDEPQDVFEDDFVGFEVSDYPVPALPLRRSSKRPVTLQELLSELKKAEVIEKKRFNRFENKKEERRATIEEVLSVAHAEDIESRVAKMRNLLNDMLEKRANIKFSDLSEPLDRAGRLMAYLSLLFLATRKEIWLEQEELFGELFIRRQETL